MSYTCHTHTTITYIPLALYNSTSDILNIHLIPQPVNTNIFYFNEYSLITTTQQMQNQIICHSLFDVI